MSSLPEHRLVVDFADSREAARWRSIDDRVMGGVSISRMEAASGCSLFTGELSLENQGGFASVRAPLAGAAGGVGVLAGARALVLACRGDGKSYRLRLRTEPGFDGVNHEARFETRAGQRSEVTLELSAFAPVWRGRPVLDAPRLDPAAVQSLGLMLADRQVGRFRLELFTLRAL